MEWIGPIVQAWTMRHEAKFEQASLSLKIVAQSVARRLGYVIEVCPSTGV